MPRLHKLLFLIVFPCYVFAQEIDATFVQLNKNVASAINDTKKVEALIKIADYQTQKELKRAEQYFLDALEIINSNSLKNDNKLRARVYVGLGVVSRRKGEYAEAISYYLKAKKIYEKAKRYNQCCRCNS